MDGEAPLPNANREEDAGKLVDVEKGRAQVREEGINVDWRQRTWPKISEYICRTYCVSRVLPSGQRGYTLNGGREMFSQNNSRESCQYYFFFF